MTNDEQKSLTYIVNRVAELNKQRQEANWEIKELADSAWEKCGVNGKVVKQLAKEQAWDAVQREERRQYEESLGECRAKLGMLADLPLGESALAGTAKPQTKGNSGYKGKGRREKPAEAEAVEA